MNEVLEIMMWPFMACLLLPGILVYFGLHIVKREIIFVDLALAQIAALGICMAILLGHDSHDWQTTAWSAGFTLVGAGVLTALKPGGSRVPLEAFIGIVYVVAAAAGILLLSRSPEGNEELRRTLVGEVLLVNQTEVMRTFALFAAVGVVHVVFRRHFLQLTFGNYDGRRRWKWFWDFLFYALFGIVVTSFVRIGGVLLVFSYLIIPAVCATLLTGGILRQLATGWFVAILGSMGGLYSSYCLDLPTGAAIVCALGAALLLTGIGKAIASFRRRVITHKPDYQSNNVSHVIETTNKEKT